jgi:hypothetical protein
MSLFNQAKRPEEENLDHEQISRSKQDEAERLFCKLPKPLQDHWQEKFDDLYGQDSLDFINKLLSEREKVRSFSLSENENLSNEGKIWLEAFTKKILGAKYNPREFLGDGVAGFVYRVPENPSICVKYMRPQPEKPPGHVSAYTEYRITIEIKRLTAGTKIKTPEIFSYLQKGDSYLYVMETINGFTIDNMIKGKLGNLRNLPTPEIFKSALLEYFDIVHRSGFAHNDLHGRNIMIDTRSKMPAIIDFSKSIQNGGFGENPDFERAKDQDLRDIAELSRRYNNYYNGLTNN